MNEQIRIYLAIFLINSKLLMPYIHHFNSFSMGFEYLATRKSLRLIKLESI